MMILHSGLLFWATLYAGTPHLIRVFAQTIEKPLYNGPTTNVWTGPASPLSRRR